VCSIGGSGSGGNGGAAYAVRTAVNVGSELLIFVLRAAHNIQTIPDDRRNRRRLLTMGLVWSTKDECSQD